MADLSDAVRVGAVADTHDELVDWDAIQREVAGAFAGVDAIVHCGDLTSLAVLDRLQEIAPVVAIRSAGDPPSTPPRLTDGPLVLTAGRFRVAVHRRLADDEARDAAAAGRPDLVVFGGTHVSEVSDRDGVLFVNPGSPSLADVRTVAVIDLADARPAARIVTL
ncbi:MAG TPA: metallophosphoesterase family protein [Acidimicrobiales bacterium]|jgi:putative phosphoesterase|nr:metallophosphoesterase family protein [Acidimicrobiales bacterium]